MSEGVSAAVLRLSAGLLLTAGLVVAGGAYGQVLEVHVDGSVVMYDGATETMSPGAHPMARIISGQRPQVRRRGMAAPPPTTAAAIHASAERHHVSEQLVEAVAWQESRFNAAAVSPKGARGTMQLMPSTALALGVDASNPESNIDGGADYLSQMLRRFGGDKAKALAAYNAGPALVDAVHGVPAIPETRSYVARITAALR